MKLKLFIFACLTVISADTYAQNAWNQKANWPATARHRTVAFSIGNKGYMGLGHYNSGPGGNTYLADIWEYDPSSNTWTQKADFAGGKRYHAVGITYKTTAFVGTGRDEITPFPSETYQLENDWWEFDPVANSWIARATFPGTPRRGAIAFLIDSLIFLGTGQVNSGYTDDFWAYDAENDVWLAGVPPLPGGSRTSAVAFSIDGKGYAGTGGIGCGSVDFYEYKLSTNTWTQRANVGTLIRNEAFGFSLDGKGYILTGDNCSSGTNYKDFWEYDPNTDSWTELAEFPGSARRYMNGFVIGSKVYCGSGTSGVNYSDLWEWDKSLASIENEAHNFGISHYPNPAANELYIQLNNGLDFGSYNELTIYIYTVSGRLVTSQKIENDKTSISLVDFEKGTFLYVISNAQGILKQDKFIIQ